MGRIYGSRIPSLVEKMGISKDKPATLGNLSQVMQYIEKILAERQLTVVNELHRLSSLYEIIALIIENHMESHKTNVHDYSQGTYVKFYSGLYQNFNYGKRIKIDELAEMIGISRSHLTLSLKKELNVSPQDFLLNLRMEKACEQLKDGSEPINIVAANVGYGDSMAFSKAFKQRMGVSPKSYRETKVELVKEGMRKGTIRGECPL